MVKISLNLNVNSVVRLLNGSAGEILTSVSHAISGNVLETMSVSIRRINFQNVLDQENVLSEETTMEMDNRKHWDVQFVETINKTVNHSDR